MQPISLLSNAHQKATTANVTSPVLSRPGTRWEAPYASRLLMTDVAIVVGSILVAQFVRFGQSSLSTFASSRLPLFSILFALLWLSALAIFHTRSPRVIGGGIDEYRSVVSASFWTFGAIAIGALLFKLEIARGYLAVALPVGTVGLIVGRHVWRLHISRARSHGRCQTSVVAIGDQRAVSVLARELMRNPADGYRIVGVGVPGYGDARGETMVVNG